MVLSKVRVCFMLPELDPVCVGTDHLLESGHEVLRVEENSLWLRTAIFVELCSLSIDSVQYWDLDDLVRTVTLQIQQA